MAKILLGGFDLRCLTWKSSKVKMTISSTSMTMLSEGSTEATMSAGSHEHRGNPVPYSHW